MNLLLGLTLTLAIIGTTHAAPAGPIIKSVPEASTSCSGSENISIYALWLKWQGLPPAQKQSLEAQGFTEENWDQVDYTNLLWYDLLHWHKLDEEKTRHLTALGWHQEMWDAKISDGIALDMTSSAFRPWNNLLPEEQVVAMALGFDSSSWNFEDVAKPLTCGNNTKPSDFAILTPELLDLEWRELSSEHRQSLICRDVSEAIWNHEQDDELFWYHFFYWHELYEGKERHLTTLGWDQEAWDAKVHDDIVLYRPSSEVRAWSKVSPEHKEAALALGFDSHTWYVRDWEGDRPFQPQKLKLDIPELLELDLDYLRTLDFKVNTVPEGKPGQDDETIPFIQMDMPEFVDSLREGEGKNLYMKYEDTESGYFPPGIESSIEHFLPQALQNTYLKEVGQFGPEYDDIVKYDYVSMYVGGVNSTSQVHLDLQSFGFIYVVEGVKRVIIIPNDERTSDHFPMVKQAFFSVWPEVDILNGPLPEHAQEVFLKKGEGMQIPYFSWHAVQNLEPCISYGLLREWPHRAYRKWIPKNYDKSPYKHKKAH